MNFIYKNRNIGIRFLDAKSFNSSDYEEWFNDFDVCRFNSHGIFNTKNKEKFLEDIDKNRSSIIFSIHTIDDEFENRCYNLHIGNCAIQNIDWINKSAELAIIIGKKEFWNKGIAKNIIYWLTRHCFFCLGLHRVWSGTSSENIAMQKVFEKLGFDKEAIFKEAKLSKISGSFVDIFEYAILENKKENFKELNYEER